VQRWLKFATYLKAKGFDIHVLVPENPDYPVLDPSLIREIPEGVNVIKVPIMEPSRWASTFSRKRTKSLQKGIISKKPSKIERVLIWLRGNFFIPDARIGWKSSVVKRAADFLTEYPTTTLITSGPPHSIHLAGLELAQQFPTIKWMADFRDPWTTIGYHKDLKLGNPAIQKHIQLEHQVLNNADKIIVTSHATKLEFDQKTDKDVILITNGFDINVPDNFNQPKGKFTISHIGTLLSERNPKVLWDVVGELTQENQSFKEQLQLRLAGNVSDDVVRSIEDAGLNTHLELLGYVNHHQAVQFMQSSQCVLLIEINSCETQAIIPGKIFEYLASRRPIIAIGPQESDVKSIILENRAGSYFSYDQKEPLKAQLQHLFDRYQQGENYGNDHLGFLKYHRRETTQLLIHEIDKLWA
jgi:glycosyltransferase involved in cell wall biosynthesis